MALPGLFPIYPDPVPMKYQVSLSLPPLPVSKISESIGVTASAGFLVPNIDYLQNFIKGDIGIADKMMKESMFKTFNDPIAQKDEKVFKQFAKITDSDIPDVNKYKKDGKIKLPKSDVKLPPLEGVGFKGFEKTMLTSIFETQKPYFEVAKLVIGNIAKIEDVVARVMPLLGVPLKTKSLKPVGNNGAGNRPKAIGYQGGKDLKVALAKLQKLSKEGSTVKIDKDGNATRDTTPSATASVSEGQADNTNWQIVSTVYSTGVFKSDVEYKYIYVDLPPERETPEELSDLNLEDDDPYSKYKPEKIILGIFKSDGSPLNPNEFISTIGMNGNNLVNVPTTFKKADWILRSPKWHLPPYQSDNRPAIYSWPSFGTPTFTWERYAGVEKRNSKTKPENNSPGQEWQLKKYKEGDMNVITNEPAIKDSPVIVGFDAPEATEYTSYLTDTVRYKMYQSEDLEQEEKDTYVKEIMSRFQAQSHLENVYLYGQSKSSVYKEVNGKPAYPDLMRISFKPFQIYSASASQDIKLAAYNKSQGQLPGMIWIDPESDYETKVIRVDPTTNIAFEEAKGEPVIKSTIKSFIKNKAIFKFSNDQSFNIDITKNNNDKQSFTNLTSYTLENWNYNPQATNKLENDNTYDISIWSENSSKNYKSGEIFKDSSGNWVEVLNVAQNWTYKQFSFDTTSSSYNNDYKAFLNATSDTTLSDLYKKYLSNSQLFTTFQVAGTSSSVPLIINISLNTIFSKKVYNAVTDGKKILNDGSPVEVVNNKITKWFYLESTYDVDSLPVFGKERTITIDYEGDINNETGNLPVTDIDKEIPLYQIKTENSEFPYGKVIDPSKITNEQLTTDELFSKGKYGHGDVDSPQEIDVIKRYMLTDLDTESYYIIEGILVDKNEQTDNVPTGNGAGSGASYYKLPHAIGAVKVFMSLLTDIFSKLIPMITKLLALFKNPASFVTEILKEKLGEGFSIFSKDAFGAFDRAKDEEKNLKDKKPSERVKKMKDLFKNSPLSNHVFINKKGDYKFLLDGVAMLPFELFGKQLPFGMEMNFDDIKGTPIKLINKFNLPNAKVKNLQAFLKPSLKNFKGPGSDGLAAGLNLSDLKSIKEDPIYKSNLNNGKTNPNDFEVIDIKYSTGEFISGIDYNYVYITQDTEKVLSTANEIVNTPDEAVSLTDAQKSLEELNDELKKDPNNKAIKDMLGRLKNKIRGLNDTSQPLLKMLLGFVTLPIKIVAGIIEWLMDFFKSLTNPLTLPAKIAELLSFSWLMKFFTPIGILDLAGIKFKPELLALWLGLVKSPNIKPPNISPKIPDGVNLPELKYYKDASPKGKFLIPDDFEIADLSQVLSMPFMPKLPTYTARQFRENPTRPVKLVFPMFCLFEKIINGIIDFIWSTLGIEALIPAPHIKLCKDTVNPDINDAVELGKELKKEGTEPVKTETGPNDLDPNAGFLYDITLDDGTVVKGLNYEQLQKYIKDHEDIGYDFKF